MGPFYVLVGAHMPAVLVECGFLSNSSEAQPPRLREVPGHSRTRNRDRRRSLSELRRGGGKSVSAASRPTRRNPRRPRYYPRGEEALYWSSKPPRARERIARAYLEVIREEARGASLRRRLGHRDGARVHCRHRRYDARAVPLCRRRARPPITPSSHQKLCVVARGGYGRARAEPLLRHRFVLHPRLQARAVRGNRDRNHAACAMGCGPDRRPWNPQRARMRADGGRPTSRRRPRILDARFLAGDDAIYADLRQLLVAEVLNRNQHKFFQIKLEESRERHAKYGDSIYLLGAATEGRRRRTARSAHRAVAGEGQIQNPFGRGAGQTRDYHRAGS